MLTKLTAIATAALTAFTLSAAAPVNADTFDNHRVLWTTIQNVGISTYLNPSQVCDGVINGAYISSVRAMVICQDNATPDGPEVAWTANDLDTLRHEAQHLIQDCVDGEIGDNDLSTFFGTDEALFEYLQNSTLTSQQIDSIIKSYVERGADEETLRLELEAFATAQDISPLNIANVVSRACAAN